LNLPLLVQELLEEIEEAKQTYFGWPVEGAAATGDVHIIQLLLEKGFTRWGSYYEAEKIAAANGHLPVMRMLLNSTSCSAILTNSLSIISHAAWNGF
jgi:hypothetical protein